MQIVTINKPPVEQRVIDESLQHGHHTVLVLPQHSHHIVTCLTEVALNSSHLECNASSMCHSIYCQVIEQTFPKILRVDGYCGLCLRTWVLVWILQHVTLH